VVLLVNQKCGACKKSFTGGYVQVYSGIGPPFVTCERCGAVNNNSGSVSEWSLRSTLEKGIFLFEHVFSIIVRCVLWMLPITVLLATLDIFESHETDGPFILTLVAVFLCLVSFGLLRFFMRLKRAIQSSNARMQDADYVAELVRLGLA